MEVIVSHIGTDFDALAAMVACAKLHPQAHMLLAGGQNPGVRQFIALHRDLLQLHRADQLDLQTLSRLYIVDAQGCQRLGELAWLCSKADSVIIYDHHPPFNQGPGIQEQTGAATTILVEQLKQQNLPITPFEATLFLLGIYEDTHCLTSAATTVRDLLAAAWLLEQGASLPQVSQYINIRLAPEQRRLFEVLLEEAKIEIINQRSILVTAASLEQFVSGLGQMTQRLVELEDCDIAISIVQMENRVHLVARSQRQELNLLNLLAPLGIKGHAGAVTLTARSLSPGELYSRVMASLKQRLPQGQVAGDFMSAPVKTVFANTAVAEAHRLLLRYGHTGMPVINQRQAVIGIVTRRDIEKAMRHDLGHAPVRGYMTRNVITADVLDPVSEVTRIIVQNDIGRVPVLDRGRLVGIITRTDLLKQMHGDLVPRWHQSLFSADEYRLQKPMSNLTDLVNSRLPQRIQGILMVLGQIAQQEGYKVYAVGGFVRDLLLGLPNWDLDVAVENNAINFARKIALSTGGKLAAHEEIGTATLTLRDGFQIDFATARMEFYQFPAATPEVEQTTIKHDLYRRDFTINTLAFALNSDCFGEFLDFFGGYADLQAGRIRVLYNLSFVEDPTRILRAVRFVCRYGFHLEEETRIFLHRALADNMLAKTPAARLGKEMRQMFMEPNVPALLSMARELGVLQNLIPSLEWSSGLEAQIIAAARISQWNEEQGIFPRGWLLYPLLLLKEIPREHWLTATDLLGLRGGKEQKLVEQVISQLPVLGSLLQKEGLSASAIYDLLNPLPTLALLALLAANPGEAGLRSRVLLYLEKLADMEIAIDGNDLLQLGVPPGPDIGRILKTVHRAKLEGQVLTKEEELALADRLRNEEG